MNEWMTINRLAPNQTDKRREGFGYRPINSPTISYLKYFPLIHVYFCSNSHHSSYTSIRHMPRISDPLLKYWSAFQAHCAGCGGSCTAFAQTMSSGFIISSRSSSEGWAMDERATGVRQMYRETRTWSSVPLFLYANHNGFINALLWRRLSI